MSALGKVVLARRKRALNCLMVVILGSWSLLLMPTAKITIFAAGWGRVFSHIFRKWYALAPG